MRNKIELTKDDYYQYNYHVNKIAIFEHWKKTTKFDASNTLHREILGLYHHSLHVKDIIDKNMWRRHLKSKANQEKLASLESSLTQTEQYFNNLSQEDISHFKSCFPFYSLDVTKIETQFKSTELSENAIQYISLINAERVFLGVIRNFYSFMLRNSWYFDVVKQLNQFSIFLAQYLYILRLHLSIYVMLTVQESEHFKLSYYERAYGYFKANLRQILNDIFWSIFLSGISIHLYIQNSQIDKFFSQEITGLGINICCGIALLFDVWNSYQAVVELKNDWKNLISEHQDLENELKASYEKILREKMSLVYFTSGICFVSLISGLLEIGDYIAKINPSGISESLVQVIPFVNIALISSMFLAQLIYLTRDYWDKDYQNLPEEEKKVIRQKALNQAIEESIKIIIFAIVIFVIASHIPLGGIPQMLILALLTIAMIAFVKMIKDYIEKHYQLEPKSDEGESLQAAKSS